MEKASALQDYSLNYDEIPNIIICVNNMYK